VEWEMLRPFRRKGELVFGRTGHERLEDYQKTFREINWLDSLERRITGEENRLFNDHTP